MARNLFVSNLTPTQIISTYNPDQIRGQVSRNLFGQLPAFGGGPMGGSNMGGAAIGMGLGYGLAGLMGAQPPEAARLQSIQNMGMDLMKTMNIGKTITPEQQREFVGRFGTQLMKAGYTDEAFKIMSMAGPMEGEGFEDFRKEERKRASDTVKTLDKRAAEIRGASGKMKQLSDRAKKFPQGSVARRQAVNSMIANIVRLNSPGIVSEEELRTYTGGQGLTSAFVSLLAGRDPQYEALMAAVDPSGADPDSLRELGNSLILGEAGPLFDQYEDAKSRATRAKISQRAYSTNFGEGANKNLEELRKLTQQPAASDELTPEEQKELKALEQELGL